MAPDTCGAAITCRCPPCSRQRARAAAAGLRQLPQSGAGRPPHDDDAFAGRHEVGL